ncbi:hypothetical protein KJ567_00305 [Candidatus Bipolaricaulota bacterium]|nr:hypothetical protein [Candidatus Bipolaricaulota bacterium]
MSERKLYEVAIRILGLLVAVLALGWAGQIVQTVVMNSDGALRAGDVLEPGISMAAVGLAAVFLLAFARRLARFFARGVDAPGEASSIGTTEALHVGIVLIGVYTITFGIAMVASSIVNALDAARETSGFSNTFFGPRGQWISPLVRVAIGFVLVFYPTLARSVRRSREETRSAEHEGEPLGHDDS